jgi:hypothetical protein
MRATGRDASLAPVVSDIGIAPYVSP